MLTQQQITEIKEHLENARNPIFFFDNDPDGLCSFLLLQRYISRGRGVAIKSLPGLNKSYFKKVEEFKADYIFVLDKPLVDPDFIELANKAGIPLIYIDHHNVPVPEVKYYYNPYLIDKTNEPVSYLCYNITRRKEDLWIAAIGCITDSYVPDFMDDLAKQYQGLLDHTYKNAFDVLYNTQFGKICMIVSFGIKDKTSNVVALMKFMMAAKSPYDITEENNKTKSFLSRFEHINERYQRLLTKVDESIKGDFIFYTYSGDLSISQYMANELLYRHPDKIIVVAYTKGNISNISLRWSKDIRIATINAIKDIEGASGGGHEHASGARMPADKLGVFKENLLREVERIKKESGKKD